MPVESTAEESKSADRLALLYRVSQSFNTSLELDRVLNTVLDECIASTRAERGFLLLSGPGEKFGFRAARGMDQTTIDQPEFQVSRGVVLRVLEEGTPLLASNAQVDDRLSGRQSIMALGLRSILCVPLQHKGETLGVVYVDNRLQSGIFTPDDLDLLRAIASSAAVAIENARLYQVSIEKARLERELQVARQVQVSLLPRSVPQRTGWEFAASWQPALEVAGDFYDFVHLDENHLAIVVADVADKGMPAALFMATTRTTIRTMLTREHSPGRALTLANQLLCDDASHGMFVTVFCGVLELGSGRLRFANAGHNPPIVCGGGASSLRTLGRTGMALGIERDSPVDEAETRIGNGDFVASYTDGVTEASNPGGEQFGVSRLEEILQETGLATAQAIVDSVGRSVLAFCGSQSLLDDITLVVARRDA